MIRSCVFAILALCLFSCDSKSPPPRIEGDYEIKTVTPAADVTYDLSLSESSGQIEGTGTLTLEDKDSASAITSDLDVSGSHSHPSLSLSIEQENDQTSRFEATVSDPDAITGTLTTPIGNQQTVTLRAD